MRIYNIILLFLLLGCSDDSVQRIILDEKVIDDQVTVSLSSSSTQIVESQRTTLSLDFNKATAQSGQIKIAVEEMNGVYNQDYFIIPAVVNDTITFDFDANTTSIDFSVHAIADADDDTEMIEISIGKGSDFLVFDPTLTMVISFIEDINNEDENINREDILTVATWNIERYPKKGTTTINAVQNIILNTDVDIIALQEIDDITAFNTLVKALNGWEGKLYNVRGGIELAYLYKTSEITSFSDLSIIFDDDRKAFPRQPVLGTATHKNGLEVSIFNIHLKCCGMTGSEEANRREAASIALQNYINTHMANDNVLVVGDWNDDISDGPFDNFLSDSDNFVFADFDIGNGSSSNWSFPSRPSHLDHILITNELTDNLISTETLKLDQTTSNYNSNVSDHRPVVSSFSN